ncbi:MULTISPECIES: hypothetical protein [unclassified Pseudoalteromonas]|uniref:hypothetical protein n=1 Tax=unclassified Pseudoalteromonas TaxID=194690 RepID=UPI00094F868F|nr:MULTISPECIES: hypothetical protein [unclassified Pseudoalteromonas]
MLPTRVKFAYAVVFCVASIMMFASYISAKYSDNRANNALTIVKIENRIALDLNYLNLPDDFLKHSGSKDMVLNYIEQLNSQLSASDVFVYSIEGISEYPARADLILKQLHTPQKSLSVSFVVDSSIFEKNDIVVLILVFGFAGLFTYLLFLSERTKIKIAKHTPDVEKHTQLQPKLIVDLKSKTLSANCDTEKTVALANKPLCFYLALVEFCVENPDVILNQNKDVPDELLALANKYFYRLVELGHTIRKRPNFTNSLEKTLSEIRAALDEVWQELPEIKDTYYPPKAHGEGSRSRLHHYGLKGITLDDIEVIGK